jgi:hypothetical protein
MRTYSIRDPDNDWRHADPPVRLHHCNRNAPEHVAIDDIPDTTLSPEEIAWAEAGADHTEWHYDWDQKRYIADLLGHPSELVAQSREED